MNFEEKGRSGRPAICKQPSTPTPASSPVTRSRPNRPTIGCCIQLAKATRDPLGVESLRVVGNAGYWNGAAAAAREAHGITACVPTNRSVNNQGDGTMFDRSAFAYQPKADTYICPAGYVLARKQVVRDSLILYAASDCTGCPLKPRCTMAGRRFVAVTCSRKRSNECMNL